MDCVSILLGATVLVVAGGGLFVRWKTNKGIGWQYIRFNVIAMGVPICALLALNNALTEGAVAVISGAMAYAFGKASDDK